MTATPSRSGFFRTVLGALVDARQREADRHVSRVFLSLDDETRARPSATAAANWAGVLTPSAFTATAVSA